MTVHPAKTQFSLGIRQVWSESSLCAQWVAKDASFPHADSEDADQTGRMPRLNWVFAGRTCHFVGFDMRWLNKYQHPKLNIGYSVLVVRRIATTLKAPCCRDIFVVKDPGRFRQRIKSASFPLLKLQYLPTIPGSTEACQWLTDVLSMIPGNVLQYNHKT